MWDYLGKLSLVVAAAVAGFVLGPLLTTRWQNHADNLARKSALVERMSNASGRFLGAVRVQAHKVPSATALDAAFAEWQIESEAIHTQIAGYVGASVAEQWVNFSHEMTWVYYLFTPGGPVTRSVALHRVAAYLGRQVSTLNGLLDSAFRTRTIKSRVKVTHKAKRPIHELNPTHENALNTLVQQFDLKQRAIISTVLHKHL
jgi:hypothetical protein